jgi:hypothetical protein
MNGHGPNALNLEGSFANAEAGTGFLVSHEIPLWAWRNGSTGAAIAHVGDPRSVSINATGNSSGVEATISLPPELADTSTTPQLRLLAYMTASVEAPGAGAIVRCVATRTSLPRSVVTAGLTGVASGNINVAVPAVAIDASGNGFWAQFELTPLLSGAFGRPRAGDQVRFLLTVPTIATDSVLGIHSAFVQYRRHLRPRNPVWTL